MSLENLLKIGQLDRHETDSTQVSKLLESSARSLDDARHDSITPETRLEAAYRTIMQLSMIALWANGYRPTTSGGHHMTMIQSLVHTVGLDNDHMRVLDTFRVKRHAINYSGEDMDIASVEACIEAGDHLMSHVRDWLIIHKPELNL